MRNFYESIQSHLDKFANMVYTVSVARIYNINYDKDGYIESLDVVPQVQNRYSDGVITDRTVIFKVPVLFPSSSQGILSFPLQVKDPVLLAFSKEDVESYLDTGKYGPPKSFRKFDQSDAIAIPCVFPDGESPGIDSTNVVLKFKDASIVITPEGSIVITAPGDATVDVGGDLQADIKGSCNVTAGSVSVDSTGACTVSSESVDVSTTGACGVNSSGFSVSSGGEELLSVLQDLCTKIVALKDAESRPLQAATTTPITAIADKLNKILTGA